MNIDIHKLKALMYAASETNISVGKKLDINRDTLRRWLKNENIPLNKVHELISILNMSDEIILETFFMRENPPEKFII
jgi:hypothetical protein|nr:MAG TPA: helix-turn-helix domain protein [Caudoviricetes sp.]